MCGIAGIWASAAKGDPAGLGSQVDTMLAAMLHRGPDQGGRWAKHLDNSSIVLGGRRLAIQDLTEAGSQPMVDPVTGNAIVFNGEIYNFPELHRELTAMGDSLTSDCDTEVVLRGYARWGAEVVDRLRGMFAFAIWDVKTQSLFLARDRLGVKPLYYHRSPGLFAFASEVRALLQGDVTPANLSPSAIRSYLAFGAVSEPVTIIQNVRAFPPGHHGFVRSGQLELTRYWSLAEAFRPARGKESPTELDERIQALLSESIKLRLISDAPIGVFLSGGLDSTVVATIAAANSPQSINSVSVVFKEREFSEKLWIDRTVSHIGSTHYEVELTESELLRLIPTALPSYDQPTVDAINTYIVSMHARQAGLTVALSGIGGDELFGGYPAFKDVPKLRSIRRTVPARLVRAGISLLDLVASRRDRFRKLSQYFLSDGNGGIEAELVHRELFLANDRRSLAFEGSISPVSDLGKGHWIPPELDDFNAISYSEMTGYLLNTLLRDTDFASMANSLEVREPYLDHHLIGAVASLPGAAKQAQQTKWLLRRVARRIVPESLIQPGKRGFSFPMDRWLREGLRQEVDDVLRDPTTSYQLSQIICQREIERVWTDFTDHKVSWTRPWALFVIKSWARSWAK